MEKNSLKWGICLLLMIIFCGLAGCAQEQPVQPVEISSFSEEYFNVAYPEDGKIELECTFTGNGSLVYGWYIYERFHKEEPVEKIKYSENPILQYTFPDPIKQYSIKCFVRDDQNDVQKSAWVPEESIKNNPANSLQDFNRLYVTVYEEEDNTYLLVNNFTCPEEFQTGWYVYRAEDKTDPIYKKSYSPDSILSFTLPEEGTEYAVKAFVKNMETGEQKSAWVAYLPEEDWEEAADPIPEFTREDIERTLLSGGGGYGFTNTFEGGMGEFRIYERLVEKEILTDTIVGNSMVFDNYDENTNYRLAAYEKMPDGQEKELDFYYIYGKEYQELLVAGMPTIVMSLEDLLKGTYMGYDISYPLDWTLPEISSRNERGRILAFRIFHPLLKEYLQTSEEKYGEICLNYIESWLDDYSVVPLEEDDDMWSDFCVARRVQFFSVARILFDHQIDNELLEKLEFHLEQCCDLLTSKFYYKDKHNHGMMQDFALLTYLDAFGYLETHREEYTELAYDRLWEYFTFSIAADGVHKEHSPAYHVDILNSLEWIMKYSSAQGNPRFEDKAGALVDKMYRFYLDLTEPDFTVPPLGDSYCVIDYPNSMEGYEYGEWLLSKGQEGLAPAHTMAVYPEGGYAFMRSSWTDPAEEATWICLTAATHSTAHKHQDDLSFILYHKGQLFTEAGKRDYNYDDLETTYAYSSYAHNVLFVNYEGWPMNAAHHPVIDRSAYRTQITDFGQNDDIMWATGRSERWETVLQERTICYNPKDHFVSITDRLTAAESENIRLIYHIAEGIEITQEEDGWILARDGSEIAVVHVNATSDSNLSVLQGEEQDGEFKTWLFDQSHVDTPMYGGLLMVDMVCAEGENSIELQIELK